MALSPSVQVIPKLDAVFRVPFFYAEFSPFGCLRPPVHCTREMLHICVKLEHAYIRNVNVRWTHRQMDRDRHDHRLTDHVGLAQARPNYRAIIIKQ